MDRAFLAAVALALAVSTQAAGLPDIRPPKWQELSAHQKQILAPLQQDWDNMDDAGRKKWVGVAKRYPTMSPEEQQRVERRMKAWAELTPEQRRKAREQYRRLQRIAPDERAKLKDKWQEYANLPDEEKKRLKDSAASRPRPKRGAPRAAPSPSATNKPGAPRTTAPLPPTTPAAAAGAVPAPSAPAPPAAAVPPPPESPPPPPERPATLRP
jgi:Protein of unknown function (DUF3106)